MRAVFYTLNVRSARHWMVGVAAGLIGFAVWSVVERGPWASGVPLAFDREFAPVQVLPATSPSTTEPSRVPSTTAPSKPVVPAAAEPEAQGSAAQGTGAAVRVSPDEFRAQRERLRSQEMELARQVLDDPDASEARKGEAQRELLELLRRSRQELEIEQLLAAAGVPDAAVSIGDSGVQVVVPRPVTAQGAARIGELVARMAGVRRENISIIDSLTAFGP
ncbi:SpoIIIAH-like family protein [Geochorda subterranea]|uniref:SpoIIIAH-like family protein n=1 Tax=Geochorda subterranea TaxID=3109564 RepID=A0ABZ1BLN3_9FIRM|nr:SpoIIIAH-like family protein [Limnochorda sp. LNt]WRP13461.1 SpoIIIAH-like family protein [Limnochorda sp. LNt]